MIKIRQITRTAESFQQPIAEPELQAALVEHCPERPLEVIELASGLFNSTFSVTTESSRYILKVAPKDSADVFFNERFLMQRERSLITTLSAVSNLIPSYYSYFEIDSRPAFLQAYVEGQLWSDVMSQLSEQQNSRLWQQLGRFTRMLHQVHGDKFGYPEPHISCQRWSEFIFKNVLGMMDDCRRLGLLHPEIIAYSERLPDFRDELDRVTIPQLIHGDLWPRNIIINHTDGQLNIAAVIDAERAFWGEPVSDWVLLLYDLPQSFWNGYGENLRITISPIRQAIYTGMYLILNILESSRFPEPIQQYREKLQDVNNSLREFRG